MSATKQITFFGSTGGCTLNTLLDTLRSPTPHVCIALVRTHKKLLDLLSSNSISESTISSRLTVVQGNATSSSDIAKALILNGRISDLIVQGVGAAPKFQWSVGTPVTLDQPSLSEHATRALLDATAQLARDHPEKTRPFIVMVSTTGISLQRDDVPRAFHWLYHVLLKVPHMDKRLAEGMLMDTVKPSGDAKGTSGFSVVRASLLTDGKKKSGDQVRSGWEWSGSPEEAERLGEIRGEKQPGAAVGYTISRASVGGFLYEKFVDGDMKSWSGKCMTVTE